MSKPGLTLERWMEVPSTEIAPSLGRILPAIALINVDLPAPLWPINAITSPSFAVRSLIFTAENFSLLGNLNGLDIFSPS